MADEQFSSEIEHRTHRRMTPGCLECLQDERVRVQRYRDRNKRSRELRDGEWVSVHPHCPHGEYSGYIVYACRCRECKDAKKDYQRSLRERSTKEADDGTHLH